MSKHTPGPWVVLRHVGIYANDKLIASIHSPMPEPTASNARLIAAAPDLLEALIGFIQGAEAMGWSTDKARAAIAKATGEKP